MFSLVLAPSYLTLSPALLPQVVHPHERHAFLLLSVHVHEPPLIVGNVNVRVVVVVYQLVNQMLVGLAQVEGRLL